MLAQSLLSWIKVDASRDALQLALYTWMVWVSICLIGAWVGLGLRHIGDLYVYRARPSGMEGYKTCPYFLGAAEAYGAMLAGRHVLSRHVHWADQTRRCKE